MNPNHKDSTESIILNDFENDLTKRLFEQTSSTEQPQDKISKNNSWQDEMRDDNHQSAVKRNRSKLKFLERLPWFLFIGASIYFFIIFPLMEADKIFGTEKFSAGLALYLQRFILGIKNAAVSFLSIVITGYLATYYNKLFPANNNDNESEDN